MLAQLMWRRKWMVGLGGLVCAALVAAAASGLPMRFAATGLVIASRDDKAVEVNDRVTQSDILLSPALLSDVAAKLNLAQVPGLAPRYRYAGALRAVVENHVKPAITGLLPSSWRGTPDSEPETDLAMDAATQYLRQHLTVGGNENSRVLAVNFAAGTPEIAAAVVNEVMQQFVSRSLSARLDAADASYQHLMERVASAKQDADAADTKVERFQQQNNVQTLQAGSPATLQLHAQQEQLASAKLDLSQAQAAFDAGQRGRAMSSPALQALTDRETDVLQRVARLGDTGPLNPRRQSLDEELQAVRAQIDIENRKAGAALGLALDVARRRVATLQGAVSASATAAADSGNTELSLARLTRDAASKHSLYQVLLARAKDVQVAAAEVPTARIVSQAVPPANPESSRTPMIVTLGFLGGAFLTMAVILVRTLLWGKIASASSLAQTTGLRGLGSLPQLRGFRRSSMPDLVISKGQSPLAETMRGMRLALEDAASSGPGATLVLVTSAEAGEGKTTVAASLARRAAGDGVRTLLVEGDLREPRLSEVLDLDTAPTLERLLLGRDAIGGELIQTDGLSRLDCITARGGQVNPMALLTSDRFSDLMAFARKSYDLVIIDSPPVLRVADPIFLSRWADMIVFVVRADTTPQAQVLEALGRFPASVQARISTLLSRASGKRHDGKGYYSGYSSAWDAAPVDDLPRPAGSSRPHGLQPTT